MMIFPWSWSLFLVTFLGVCCSGSSASSSSSPSLFSLRGLFLLPRADDDAADESTTTPATSTDAPASSPPRVWPTVLGVLAIIFFILLLVAIYLKRAKRTKLLDVEQGAGAAFDKRKMGGEELQHQHDHPAWVKGFQLVLPRSNSNKSNKKGKDEKNEGKNKHESGRSEDSDWSYRDSTYFQQVDINSPGGKPTTTMYNGKKVQVPSLARPKRVATQSRQSVTGPQPVLPPIRRHESLMSVMSVHHGVPSFTNTSEMDQAYADLLHELHEESAASQSQSPPSYRSLSPPPGLGKSMRRRSNSMPQYYAGDEFASEKKYPAAAPVMRSLSSTRNAPAPVYSHSRQSSASSSNSSSSNGSLRGRQLTPSMRQAQPIRNLPSLGMASHNRNALFVVNAGPHDLEDAVVVRRNGGAGSPSLGRVHTALSATSARGRKIRPVHGNYI